MKGLSRVPRSYSMTISFLLVLLSFFPVTAQAAEIPAKAAVVMDADTGTILYARNPHLQLPAASTTKLVTAMVALDRIDPDTVVKISKNAANTPSVAPHLSAGEHLTVRDLLFLALMRSINGATVALAEAVAGSEESFVHMMNEKMARVGAENTCFVNASGLPGPDQHTTALELSLIMRQALRYHLIREIISTKTTVVYTLEGRRLSLKNTNQLLWSGDEFLGGKTGYTRAARHCFVSAAEKGHATLITAILGESSRDNLWLETEMLLARGLNILQDGAGPVIEVSNVIPEKPVVLASYTRSRNAHSKSKAAYSGNSKAKKYKAVKTIAKDPKKKFLAASDKKRKIAEIAVKAREDARKDSRKHFSAENQSIKKS